MSTLNVCKTVSMALLAAALCLSLRAHATTINTSLDFMAMQSIWGPDSGSWVFNDSGSTVIDLPFDLGSETFGYYIGASSGTVISAVDGSLATNFTPVLSAPGVTHIGLAYKGDVDGGGLTTFIGGAATLTVFDHTVEPSFGLGVDSTFTPWLNPYPFLPESIGIGTHDIANPSVDFGLWGAGMDVGLVQTNQFTLTNIYGTLYYQLEGSGAVQSMPFGLMGGATVPVSLDQSGTYDFWFGDDWDVVNQFNWWASLDLTAHASTLVGCGESGLESCSWSTSLAAPTIYTSDPFALNFDARAPSVRFKIKVRSAPVPVPVPHGLGLAMLGGGTLLVGLLNGWHRRRAREGKVAA